MTYHFPKNILGSRISLTYKKLTKSYDELRKNLRKILRSFENRAPVPYCIRGQYVRDQCQITLRSRPHMLEAKQSPICLLQKMKSEMGKYVE